MSIAISCGACHHGNDPWRKHCGKCGCGLPGACAACAVVNGPTDAFCGGCGKRLRAVRPRKKPTGHTVQKTIPIDLKDIASMGPRKKPPAKRTIQIDILRDIVSETLVD